MSETKLSIYEKLQTARIEFTKKPLKKSGKNKFAGYEYFELTDFLTQSDEVLFNARLTPIFNFVDKYAVLTLHDWDSDTTIEWSTNGADATVYKRDSDVPANLEIQTLGSTHTYLKRYLYMHMMNVAENDGLEKNTGSEEFENKRTKKQDTNNKNKTATKATKEQINDIKLLFEPSRIPGLLKYYNVDKLEDISETEASKMIDIEKRKQDGEVKEQSDPMQQSINDL